VNKDVYNASMIALCPRQVWWSWVHSPTEQALSVVPPPKIARRKRAKSSTITRSAVDYSISLKFCTEFKRMTPKCCKCWRSRGQRSRSQREITYQHRKTL